MIEKIIYFILILVVTGCLNSSADEQNSVLNQFLKEQELDNLSETHSKLSTENKEDSVLINSILRNWKDEQAISNLLFYPKVIPVDNRFNAIVKGLTDEEVKYYNLAAIVGVQSPEDLGFNRGEMFKLKKLLFEHAEKSSDVIAVRSTSSLAQYINGTDIDEILRSARNKVDAVQTNLLSMISALYGKENMRGILEKENSKFKIGTENLLLELEKQELKIENAPDEKKAFFELALGMPVSVYIPNLTEFK